MNNLIISIFGNQIFLDIINNLGLFSKFKIKYYDNLSLCVRDAINYNHLVIFFKTEENKEDYEKLEKNSFPIIVISESSVSVNISTEDLVEKLSMSFKILDLEKRVVSLIAKYEFKKSSLINLHGYRIDKNERKIKKNNLELQLTEKEISFLILFSKNNKPLTRNFVLKNVWNYSSETDTHTVETHIHRLRKKIFNKFNDKNFIKNNDEGYYI